MWTYSFVAVLIKMDLLTSVAAVDSDISADSDLAFIILYNSKI